jgi:hypothetical protein
MCRGYEKSTRGEAMNGQKNGYVSDDPGLLVQRCIREMTATWLQSPVSSCLTTSSAWACRTSNRWRELATARAMALVSGIKHQSGLGLGRGVDVEGWRMSPDSGREGHWALLYRRLGRHHIRHHYLNTNTQSLHTLPIVRGSLCFRPE